jgi:hypothetical protein
MNIRYDMLLRGITLGLYGIYYQCYQYLQWISLANTGWRPFDSLPGNEEFFARSRRSRDCAEAYREYAAQGIPQIDTEIVEKGRFLKRI